MANWPGPSTAAAGAAGATNGAGSGRDALVGSIYHERQEAGSMLCGNHALNNLLQSQLWTADDLATIARQLDDLEDATFDEELRAKRRGRSANYDDSGFFSIQVLDSALNRLDLCLTRWRSSSMRRCHGFPESQSAFILHRRLHWLALRRFNGDPDRWYNLDSCSAKPVWIGPTFLGLTLEQAESEGYSVFVVRPSPSPSRGRGQFGEGEGEGEEGEEEEERPPPGESFLHACEADEAAFQMDVGQAYAKVSSASSSSSNGSNKRHRERDGDGDDRNGTRVDGHEGNGSGGGKRARLGEEVVVVEEEEEEEGEEEDEEEAELRRAIAASLLDDRPAPSPVARGTLQEGGGGGEEEEDDYGLEEDEDGGFLPIAAPSTSGPGLARGGEEGGDDELDAAIRASLEVDGGGGGGWDEPSPEELRRKRLARFG